MTVLFTLHLYVYVDVNNIRMKMCNQLGNRGNLLLNELAALFHRICLIASMSVPYKTYTTSYLNYLSLAAIIIICSIGDHTYVVYHS